MALPKFLTEHLAGAGGTYFSHMLSAFVVALKLLTAAVAAFLHALFPFLFGRVAVTIIEGLHGQILAGRARAAAMKQGR